MLQWKDILSKLENVIKALKSKTARILYSRLLLILFCFGAYWQLVYFVDTWYPRGWYFTFTLLPLFAETIYAWKYHNDNKGKGDSSKRKDDISKPNDDTSKRKDDMSKPYDDISEPNDDISKPNDDISKSKYKQKWFMLHIFLFLIAAFPSVWLVELNVINLIHFGNLTQNCNTTRFVNAADALSILEQAFIFFMILSKWLLPKQKMSLDDLMQLLFNNLAAGADIVDFISPLRDNDCTLIRSETALNIAIGVATVWSLLQFPFNLTAKKNKFPPDNADVKDIEMAKQSTSQHESNGNPNRSFRSDTKESALDNNSQETPERNEVSRKVDKDSTTTCNHFCFYSEIWALRLTLLFQDVPFLSIRLTILIYYKFFSATNIFFTLKNIFVIALSWNRIRAIKNEARKSYEEKQPWSRKKSMATKQNKK